MKKKFSVFLLIIVFAGALFFMESQGLLKGFMNGFGAVTSPASLFLSESTNQFTGFFNGLFSLSSLQKENTELRSNNNQLQAEIAQLKEVRKENDKLRAELKFISENKYTYEAAEVTNFDPSNLRSVITINRGSKSGIKEGMAIISEGFLIGRVTRVFEGFSNVKLVTDPSSSIPVTLQQNNTNGLAKGEIGFGVSMEKIAQGEIINSGDTVITSGLGGEIPKGLIIGYVSKVNKKPNSLFTSADIKIATRLTSLNQVIVIKY